MPLRSSVAATCSRNSGVRCASTNGSASASSDASTPHTASRPRSLAPRSATASAMNARASSDSTSPCSAYVEHHLGAPRPRSRRARGRSRAPGARRACATEMRPSTVAARARCAVAAATTSAAQSTAAAAAGSWSVMGGSLPTTLSGSGGRGCRSTSAPSVDRRAVGVVVGRRIGDRRRVDRR